MYEGYVCLGSYYTIIDEFCVIEKPEIGLYMVKDTL